MIEKEFIPHQESVELKELGFDEPCFAYRDGVGYLMIKEIPHCVISAPTFSQAFRWFREKYRLRNTITDFIDDKTGIEWDYEIAIIGTDLDERGNYKPLVDYSIDDEIRKFKTYEDAELACLRKLIEMVKGQI